jgi:hypothetical protein
MRSLCSSLALAAAVLLPAQGAILINEIMINPPGTDNGTEYFEFYSTTGGVESLAGLWLIEIDGDTTNSGLINKALDLGAFSTGTNGLFLYRDSATVLLPAPEAATTITSLDFPDTQNGSGTFLLVSGFTGAAGNDLDTDNDGTLNTFPWASVLDGIGVAENDAGNNFTYAAQVGFFAFGPLDYTPDAVTRLGNGGLWVGADLLGGSPGPFTLEDLETTSQNGSSVPSGLLLSPGRANPVPEPASAVFALLGVLGILRRRR